VAEELAPDWRNIGTLCGAGTWMRFDWMTRRAAHLTSAKRRATRLRLKGEFMKSSFRLLLIAAAAFGALAVSSLAQAQAQPAPAAPKPAQARPRFMPQLTPEQIAALPRWTELTMTTRDGVKLAAISAIRRQ
jgi:hypothetical protein